MLRRDFLGRVRSVSIFLLFMFLEGPSAFVERAQVVVLRVGAENQQKMTDKTGKGFMSVDDYENIFFCTISPSFVFRLAWREKMKYHRISFGGGFLRRKIFLDRIPRAAYRRGE